MAERLKTTAFLPVLLYFPTVITADEIAPAYVGYEPSKVAELYARIVCLIAEDEAGNRPFKIADANYILKLDKGIIKPWFQIVDKLLVALSKHITPNHTTPGTSFSYPPEATRYIRKV